MPEWPGGPWHCLGIAVREGGGGWINVEHGGSNVLKVRSDGDVKLSSGQHVVGRS